MHLVVGNLSIDNLIEVEDMPKPNEDLFTKNYHQFCGGATGNIAAMLSNLGLNVSILSKVGSDYDGKRLVEDMEKYGIDISNIYQDKNIPTSVFTCVMDRLGNRNFYLFSGASFSLTEEEIVKTVVEQWDSVSLVGMNKKQTKLILNRLSEVRNYVNIGTLVAGRELRKEDFYFFSGINNVFMNESEAKAFLESDHIDFSAYFEYSPTLENVIITRGEKGSLLHTKESIYQVEKAPPTIVENTLGCGDAFMAGWVYADIKGYNPKDKLVLGHKCARLIVCNYKERIKQKVDK